MPKRLMEWTDGARVLVCSGILVCAAGCTTQKTVDPELLGTDAATDEPLKVEVLPNCEAGQTATESGCVDRMLSDGEGGEVNLHDLALDSACGQSLARVEEAAARRRAFTSRRGQSLKIGLQIVDNECTARERHLSICDRAGWFALSDENRSFQVRYRDQLIACRRLARIYRDMIAGGLKVTQ